MKNFEEVEKYLIVVDMVNGFVREGLMADEYIGHIIPEQLRLIEWILSEKGMLAFVKDAHEKGCEEFSRYPEHCIVGTSEAELVDELKPFESDALVYLKNSTSACFAPNFMSDIEMMKKLREIIIIGCCTDICVMNLAIPLRNYFDQNNRNVEIIVPINAVETFSGPNHDRVECAKRAFELLNQSGVKLVRKYRMGGICGK